MPFTFPFVDPITQAQLLAGLNADREVVLNAFIVVGTQTGYSTAPVVAPPNAQYMYAQVLAGGGPGGAGGGGAGGGGQAGGYTDGWMNVTGNDSFSATAGPAGGDSILTQNGVIIAHCVYGASGYVGTAGAGGQGGYGLGQVVVPLSLEFYGAVGQAGFVIPNQMAISGAGAGCIFGPGAYQVFLPASVASNGYTGAFGCGGSGGVGSGAGGLGGPGIVRAFFFG